jgi:uncharacterized phage-associated protein
VEFTYDEGKFAELVLYVAHGLSDDRAGGAIKLNKVLYFADFAHVRKHGRPITGADYQKLPHGPAPRRLKPVRSRLVAEGAAELVTEEFLGYRMHRLVPLRRPDVSCFSADELATIDKVLDDLKQLTGAQVSELSHEEPGWIHAQEGESIPYEMALVAKQQVLTPTARRLALDVAERYGIAAGA